MFITRFVLCMSMVLPWTSQQTFGATRCGEREPVINICTNSEVTLTTNIFIETDNVPKKQESRCACTISPAKPEPEFLLRYLKSPNNLYMTFRLNDLVLNKTTVNGNTSLRGTHKLVLTTENLHTKKFGVCLMIDTADFSKFNITCEEIETSTTRTIIKSSSDADSDNETSSLGPIVGGAIGGVVVIFLMIVFIALCRRRIETNKSKCSQATTNSNSEENTKPLNEEDDYYMTENPMYNMPDNEQGALRSDTGNHLIQPDDDGDRQSSIQYEYIPDLSIDVHSPLRNDQETEYHLIQPKDDGGRPSSNQNEYKHDSSIDVNLQLNSEQEHKTDQ